MDPCIKQIHKSLSLSLSLSDAGDFLFFAEHTGGRAGEQKREEKKVISSFHMGLVSSKS